MQDIRSADSLGRGASHNADANKTKIGVASTNLEAVMIKTGLRHPWFDRPMVCVPANELEGREVRSPEEIKADLAGVDRTVQQQLDKIWRTAHPRRTPLSQIGQCSLVI